MIVWAEKIQKYLEFCEQLKGLDKKTVKAYRIDLKQFRVFFSESTDTIIKSDITDYLSYLNKNFQPKSVKRKMASLKAYFKYLEYEDYILQNPFSKINIKIKEPLVLPRAIPLNYIENILKTVYGKFDLYKNGSIKHITLLRDAAVLELLFATGIRVSELCGLLHKNINLDGNVVHIMGKGSRERIIHIDNTEVIGILKQYEKCFYKQILERGYFFINRLGQQLSTQSVRIMIKKYAKEASVPMHITPHMLRHSVATLLLEEDVDIRYIQHLLGHSSITTTQIYTNVSDTKQRKILSTKHPRNKLMVNLM
jgi:integrase/recombinase XerD